MSSAGLIFWKGGLQWPKCASKLLLLTILTILSIIITFGVTTSVTCNHNRFFPRGKDKENQGESGDQCLLRLRDCDLDCIDWTIVLATGRSGSTTVQHMISKLPGMNFYGEEGGLLEEMHGVQKTIRDASQHMDLSWKGARDANVTTMACMTQ